MKMTKKKKKVMRSATVTATADVLFSPTNFKV